ncbi:MAG: hypothetical protein IT374_03250, partial [Polyangiaceae bacterium]|nr:hypothetical protein [Polyangiaceae bacterium]
MNIITHIELNKRGDRRSGIAKIHGRTGVNQWTFTEGEAIRMVLGAGADRQHYEFFVMGHSASP